MQTPMKNELLKMGFEYAAAESSSFESAKFFENSGAVTYAVLNYSEILPEQERTESFKKLAQKYIDAGEEPAIKFMILKIA